MSLMANAYGIKIDGIYYNLLSKNQGAEVVAGQSGSGRTDYTGDIVIPETIKYEGVTYKVTSIGDNAFALCTELTSITFPETLNSIGENAFDNCHGLKSLTFPPSLTMIKNMAFSSCSGLTSIKFNSSLKQIGSRTFEGCCGLTSVTIPGSIKTIETSAFRGCTSLTTVTISNGVTVIGIEAFSECSSLMSVSLPSSLKSISGFNECTSLLSIVIPESVTEIGSAAFCGCSNLSSVSIPENVTTIGPNAFMDCIKLATITLPESVKKIDDYAFYDCINLKSICIENQHFYDLGNKVFAECHELEDFYCYSEMVPYCTWPFEGDGGIFDDSYIEFSTLHIPANAINSYKNATPWNKFKSIVFLPQLFYKIDDELYKAITPIVGKIIIPEAEPIKEGYTFSGWSEIPETMPAHDVTVTGTFNVNQYTITYMIDDEIYQTESVDYGSTITPPDAPEREGYTFEWIDVPETMPAHDITIIGSYTSGINAIQIEAENGKVYELNGRHVKNPSKGIYIINGKKVVVK